ncbi:MAG: hypothetical protein Kow0068_03440 [Marinilabiliales bacterium]
MKNYIKIIFTVLISIFIQTSLDAQCNITASSNTTEICEGDCVDLSSTGGCPTYLMNNDFNTGTIGSGWSSNASPLFNNPCGTFGADGTPYAWIGDASTFPRNLTTVAYSVTSFCRICFDFMMATQNGNTPCEGPDEMDEGVSLQYSTDGGSTWVDITYFCPDGNQYPTNSWVGQSTAGGGSGTPFNSWANYCFDVPPGAAGPNTMFQWHQEQVTSNVYDHWGVDNVEIFCPPPNQYTTWTESVGGTMIYSSNPYTGSESFQHCPTATTTYNVTVTDGSQSATDQLTVIVHQDPTLSFTLPASFCDNDPPYNLVGSPAGGTFSGTGVTGSTFDPSSVPTGTPIDITYTYDQYNNAGTAVLCSFTLTQSTIVNASPVCSITGNDVCVTSNSTINYTGTAGAGATYNWNFGGGTVVSGSGPGPYQIQWPTDGTYTVTLTVTDANGCSAGPCSINITVWPVGHPNCCTMPTPNAGPDAAICGLMYVMQAIPSIGTGTWTYTGPGTATFSNANSPNSIVTVDTYGTYTFTWTEDNGGVCVVGDDVVITFNAQPPGDAGLDQTICSGQSATLTATGGTSYIWDNGLGSGASHTVSPSSTTIYHVTVDDGSGCIAIDSVTVNVNQTPVSNAGPDQTLCGNTTTMQAVASVGTGTWTYTGPGTATFSDANSPTTSVSVNTFGTYTFTWTEDNNGCTDSDDVIITFNTAPIPEAGNDTTICSGTSATLTASGGTSYTWSTGQGQASITVSPTTTTMYWVTVDDGSGCPAVDSVIVNVTQTPNANAGSGGAYCSDTYTFNGIASVGTGTWTYTGPGTATFTNANNVNSSVTVDTWGTYTFTWTEDNNGCTDSDDVTITFNYTPTSDFTIAPASVCVNEDVTVTYTGTGTGTATYTWNWDGGNATPGTGQGPHTVNWTNSGNYDITLTVSEAGCNSTVTTHQVTVYPIPTSTFTITQPDCFGDDAILTYTGTGTPNATFNWDFAGGTAMPGTGIGPQFVSYNTANTYTVSLSVTENGCTSTTTSDQIIYPEQLSSSVIGTDIQCYGMHNGSADLTVTGGTTPYTYQWSNGSSQEDLTNVDGNIYNVLVTDANGCTSTAYVTITEPSQIVLTASPDKYICNGQSVNLAASASGGTGNYTYYWDGNPQGSSINVSPTTQTTYSVYVTDASGCTSNTETITVFVSPPVDIELFANHDHICPGEEVVITISINNGLPPFYIYDQYDQITMPPMIVNPWDTTTYAMYIYDQCGSFDIDSITIYTDALPPVDFSADSMSGCAPFTVNFNSLYSAQTYTWNFGDNDYANLSFDKDPEHTYDDPGVYDVTLTVTSTEGCSNSYTHHDMITVYPAPIAKFIATPEAASIVKPIILFTNQSVGASTYYWDFGDGGESNLVNPEHTYPIYPTGTYTVMLIAETNNGCLDTAYKDVTIQNEYTFYAPTAFTPDYDGINDYFYVYGNGIDSRNFKLYIFDRWGEVIFETEDINEGWDGRVKNGKIGKNGTYTWLVKYRDDKGIEHEESGAVSIIR